MKNFITCTVVALATSGFASAAVNAVPATRVADNSLAAAAANVSGGEFESRFKESVTAIRAARAKGDKEFFAEMEQQARALIKELSGEQAPAEVREAARGLETKLGMLGKPFDIKFTAIDGREVDLAQMKGKVVLVDFWATWCGPCVAEIPHVKATYDKLHSKGFEIVGISFDQDKESLENFVKDKEMEWPQYFDGQGWKNQFGQKFGIHGIPSMWLVNKKGELVDLNARGDLDAKVEKLLAE